MSRNTRPFKAALLGILSIFAFSFAALAAGENEEKSTQKETQIVEGELQSEEWQNADKVPVLEKKRYSQYALDMQLPYQAAEEESESSNAIFYILIAAIIVLLLAVLSTAMTLLGGLAKLSGKKEAFGINYEKLNGNLFLVFMFVFFGAIAYEIAVHSKYILPEAASEHGVQIDNMLWVTLGVTGLVFVITHIFLFVFAFKYRKKEGQTALYYPKNDKLEILWTTVPAIVLTILVLFGFRIWVNTTITQAQAKDSYEVEVYAYQFSFKFRYPGPDGKLGRTDYRLINLDPTSGTLNPVGLDKDDPAALDDVVSDEFYIPKDVNVKLRMRSRDVLHAAHLPHFRAQMYCVPGTPTEFNLKPLYTTDEYRNKLNRPDFKYEMACNQICGASHYAMKKEIQVVEVPDYEEWVNSQEAVFANIETDQDTDTDQLTLK